MRKDPEGTLEWTSGLGEEFSLDTSARAFDNWLEIQPDRASSWFDEMPRDDIRRPAMLKSLVLEASDSQYEGAVAAQKLRRLSATDRAEIPRILEGPRFSEERKERMLKILGE